jgi:hypothetical protein
MNETLTNIESKEGREKGRIDLYFFRHDEKEGDKTKSDTEVRLTEKGKLHAKSLSSEETDLSQAMAFGSPRKRTQETAGLIMAGAQGEINGTESLEELNEKLNSDLNYGSKLHYDPKLDFILPPSGPYFDELMTAFKAGQLMKYLVEESDAKAIQYGVETGVCAYSAQASQIAQILSKYFKILPRWENLVNDESKEYKPVMERFLASHQSVGESFLAKIIEKTKGVAERDAFILVINNQGFDFAEGFNVEILTDDNGEEKAHITYKKEKDGQVVFEYDEFVSGELIQSLILQK